MLPGLRGDALDIVEVLLVIDARALVLDGFPGYQEPKEVEAPALQAREVPVGLVQGEGPADEGGPLVVVEAIFQAGISVGQGGHLGVPAEIRAPEHERAALLVPPPSAFDAHRSPLSDQLRL